MNELNDRQNKIDSIAAAWVVRLGDTPLSDVEQQDLDQWIAKSSAHADAFDQARSAWRKMGELRFTPGKLQADIEALKRSSAPVHHRTVRKRRRRRVWFQAAAVVALLLIITGILRFQYGDPYILLAADHHTAPGAQQSVTLSDGSTVVLGPDSAIAVHYSNTERRVELLTGLAQFHAIPNRGNEHRPFTVTAADVAVRALGTEFMVDRTAKTVDVVGIAHEVEVSLAASGGNGQRRVVSPGQAVRRSDKGMSKVRSVNVSLATSWRRNRLIFDRMPLGEVVTKLNRYRRGRIIINDSDLASRQVSGVFDMREPDAALALIVKELRIKTTSLPPLVTLLH